MMHFYTQSNEKGNAYLGYLLFLLIVLCTVYLGSQVIQFYYYSWEIEGAMEAQAAKASVFRDDEIRKTLLKEIKKLELPINDERDLKINRTANKIIIDLEYEEVLYLELGEYWSKDIWVFQFNPHVEKSL